MDKRLIIFLALSIFIIFMYPFFITWIIGTPLQQPSPPVIELDEKDRSVEIETENSKTRQVRKEGDEAGHKESNIFVDEELNHEVATEFEEKLTVIESDLYRITLSSLGGTIKGWELKQYTEKDEEGNEHRIELVSEGAVVHPLSFFTGKNAENEKRVYSLDTPLLQLSQVNPEGKVKMTFKGPDGQKIVKELRFYHDQYRVNLSILTEGYDNGYSLSLGTNFGIHDWGDQRGRGSGAISLVNGEVVLETPARMEGNVTHEGTLRWIALQDKYFLSALIPEDPSGEAEVYIEGEGENSITSSIRIKTEENHGTRNFSLYVGPKEYDRLQEMRVNLDESIDFGWFISGSWLPVRLIAKPIFYLLRFFFKFTGNYGVAIILVTVLVKAILFPVTWKSLRSMKAMGAVQPKVAAIKKKWAKDKERLNKELINLYKVEKINPLGGCLPMLVQIPVFISLFNILYTTIDLRQAHFIFWVTDLSEKDPLYVLPIVMGATMILQQFSQPSTMEASQAKMMKFLPIVYTFFFLNFPSGLVLYWLVNNILTVGQQILMKQEKVAV
ncbi:MAG: membrane protein insertase YidC [Nitrospira sp.]|nr:membrane protein insertase YidC [Candidatus Manganitrophaceae bacterium]HIL35714.1 membrane protein insertase YidC [Candidatus Manganitrophaceae bacterium]